MHVNRNWVTETDEHCGGLEKLILNRIKILQTLSTKTKRVRRELRRLNIHDCAAIAKPILNNVSAERGENGEIHTMTGMSTNERLLWSEESTFCVINIRMCLRVDTQP